jgi:glycosyltransferase involved in cell wall biosynthesis
MTKKKAYEVLWISDLVVPTGFSRVAHSIIKYLDTKKYSITGLGVNYRGDPHSHGFPIFPASSGGKVYGEDRLVSMLNDKKYDILFILNDSWIQNAYLAQIKEKVTKENMPKIVSYFPVDSEMHLPEWYSNFDIVDAAVTYTDFAKEVVNHESCAPDLKVEIIPHGNDQKVFYKKYMSRSDAKVDLFRNKEAADWFIFLNAGRNQPRKRLDISIEAFALFAENKPDVRLYMHCGARDSHIDVPRFARRFSIDNKLILTSLVNGIQTVPDAVLNGIYNACDVGLNTGLGEGWGLPNVEHATTGAPQIVPGHSACLELFKDCGEIVAPKLKFTLDHSMTVGKLVDPIDVASSMEKLYADRLLYNSLAEAGMKKFINPEYEWENISHRWDKLFTRVLSQKK